MHFAAPLPWWLAVLVAACIAGAAVFSYRRPLVPLRRGQQGVLMALRGLSLAAIALLLCRPVLLLPSGATDVVIPVLVDVSRSMRIADADGETRIARAATLLRQTLLPAFATRGKVELLKFGGTFGLSPAAVEALEADGRQTDLTAAVRSARDRFRGRRVPGIVVLSDGADTESTGVDRTPPSETPVFAVGIGSPEGLPDREVVEITAGDPRLERALVDLHVSTVSRGFGRAPFTLRLLGNGQLLDTRRLEPAADGSPIEETFTVSPDPVTPTIYTAEIVPDKARGDAEGETGEFIAENNARSILVNPSARKRRVLVLAGAPGFEHSFLVRALAQDPGLEVDSIVRKGKNEDNHDTFLVQAESGRSAALTTGFPANREALFHYDALVVANLESDFFTRAQLQLAADFVAVRGGGILALGGRSFESRGLTGTPLEEVLPVELSDRRGSAGFTAMEQASAPPNALVLTADGQSHPIMRLGPSAETSRKRWSLVPALAASAAIGGPRPGASVLAAASAANGTTRPIVAVQRYGRGRSMVFAGEASWRWRMLQPSTDRSYETFWRQALRWLSSDSPEPVMLTLPGDAEPGGPLLVDLEARDRSFAPVADAVVEGTLTSLGAAAIPLQLRTAGNGRFTTTVVPERAGLYRVHAEARRGSTVLGSVDGWVNVGGSDREFADPRLNEAVLRRLARESGGRYVRAAEAGTLVSNVEKAVPQQAETERRDLWHEPWAFAIVVALLSAEWVLRRRWGLR
jgi:uncharacterized membrane protein